MEGQHLLSSEDNNLEAEETAGRQKLSPKSPHLNSIASLVTALYQVLLSKRGIIYGILSGVCGALIAAFSKLLEETMLPFQIWFIRSVPAMLCIFFVQKTNCLNLSKVDILSFCIAALCTSLSWICSAICFAYLQLGNAGVIEFNALVIMASLLGCIVIGEKLHLFEGIVLMINLIGSFLVAIDPIINQRNELPSEDLNLTYGALVAALAGIFASIKVIIIRQRRQDNFVDPVLLSGLTGMFALFLSVLLNVAVGRWDVPISLQEWLNIISLGFFSLLRELFCFSTLNYLKAADSSILFTAMIVSSYVIQIVFFHNIPEVFSLCGAFLTIVSIVAMNVLLCQTSDSDPQG